MKVSGVICEYNPLHNGHKYQLNKMRENGADCIICVMSGNFTQRGEPALIDKYARAKSAILCGADIVLELPVPFCCSSAEVFARAGVHILNGVGADEICFGSECGDERILSRCADALTSEKFTEKFKELQKNLNGSTSAFFKTIEQITGVCDTLGSNDLLGISYLSAMKNSGSEMKPFIIHRQGSNYNDDNLSGEFSSATAIRKILKDGNATSDELLEFMPRESVDVIESARNNGYISDEKKFFAFAVTFFNICTPEQIKNLAEGDILDDGDGICERICTYARKCISCEEFYKNIYNSRYTDARINRVILYSLLGISSKLRGRLPQYTTLLGASRVGCEYLSETRKNRKIDVITKPADIPRGIDADISKKADSLYASVMKKTVSGDFFTKKSPFIIK